MFGDAPAKREPSEAESAAPVTLYFETLDVFPAMPGGGNSLAVVHGADALTGAQLQRVAAEFPSNTAFILPPDDQANTAKLRVFTHEAELPEADANASIGVASVLEWRGPAFGREVGECVLLEQPGGVVPVTLLEEGSWQLDAPAFQVLAMGEGVSVAEAAACLGLATTDLCPPGPRVAFVGGAGYTLIEVRSQEVLGQCVPAAVAIATTPTGKVLAWTRVVEGDDLAEVGVQMRIRVFTANGGREEAASGAGFCCLLGLLATCEGGGGADSYLASITRWIVAQGVEMGRPSILLGECEQAGRVPRAIRVAGQSVPVMSGEMR